MKCPSKPCEAEIDDDSLFCDQCGKELRRCPVCGKLSVGKFCNVHGKPTVALREALANSPAVKITNTSAPDIRSTKVIGVPGTTSTLRLTHTDGTVLELKASSELGRKTGPFMDFLGKFETISRKHAIITANKNNWLISDAGSSNGTLVNGEKVKPGASIALKSGDTVYLADQRFSVD